MKYISLFVFFLFSFSLLSKENSESFIVHAKFDKFTVKSPSKYKKDMSVIIYNDTLIKLVGRLENKERTKMRYVNILPRKYQSLDLKSIKGETFFFYPLSPPFQRVILSIGQRSYEIPEKK